MFRIKRYLPILAVVALLSASVGLVFSQDQDTRRGQWSPSRQLGTGWWQSMVLDLEGTLHVAWYDGVSSIPGQTDATPDPSRSYDLLRYSARNLNGEWESPNDIEFTSEGGYTVRNALAVTDDGILHTVFRANTRHMYSNAYSRTAWDASTWTKPVRINDFGYYLNMVADSHNILHVAYNGQVVDTSSLNAEGNLERYECAACGDMIYVRSFDGGRSWSTPRTLVFTPNSGSEKMDFLETQSGRLYLYWDEGLDWYVGRGQPVDVRMIYTDDQGVTWSDPIILDGGRSTAGKPVQLALTETRDGALMAVWRYSSDQDRNAYYQTSDDAGVTWSEPQPIPGFTVRSFNDTPLDDYSLVQDETGTIHFFGIGYPNETTTGNPALYHIVFRQGIWLTPQRVFYSSEMRPEWPKALVGLTNDIHLTWFTRGIRENVQGPQNQTGDLRVFYSHMEGTFPLLATQAFEATKTPLPSPTPFQVLNPTLTPFPTIESAYVGNLDVTGDQYASTTVIAGLGAATLFCGLIFLLIRFRR